MGSIRPPQTAQIIPFPAGRRATLRPPLAAAPAATPPACITPGAIDAGSGWYHDAAIADANQPRPR